MLPKITSAMLVVTHACPLECLYCFVHQEPSRMTLDTAKASAEFLIRNAKEAKQTPEINFFGGEPMVMYDSIINPLIEWVRVEKKEKMHFSMTTNGVLLNDERIKFLKDNNVDILLSIDGDKETQDYNRPFHDGTSSFDILKPLIPKLISAYPTMTFRMTAIPATCQNAFHNIMFANDNGYKNFFIVPNVFEEWNSEHRGIMAEQMRKYSNYYVDCFRNGTRPITFSTFETALKDIRVINDSEEKNNFRTLPRCKADGKCGLGASKFASIHPNGNIYGCQEMTSNEGDQSIFYIGNIYDGVNDGLRYALMAEFAKHTSTGYNCNDCAYNSICDGGCVANNYLANGNLYELPEVYCWWKQLVISEAIYVMTTLGEECNEAFKKHWG